MIFFPVSCELWTRETAEELVVTCYLGICLKQSMKNKDI
jgi:hypothetical protein